jgi:hypothetical protein
LPWSSEETRSDNRLIQSFEVKGSGVEVALWKNGDNYTTTYSIIPQGLLAQATAKGIELQQQYSGASRAA